MVAPMVVNNPMKVSEFWQFSRELPILVNMSTFGKCFVHVLARALGWFLTSRNSITCITHYNTTQKQTCGMWITILHPPANYWNTWTLRHLLECSKWRLLTLNGHCSVCHRSKFASSLQADWRQTLKGSKPESVSCFWWSIEIVPRIQVSFLSRCVQNAYRPLLYLFTEHLMSKSHIIDQTMLSLWELLKFAKSLIPFGWHLCNTSD